MPATKKKSKPRRDQSRAYLDWEAAARYLSIPVLTLRKLVYYSDNPPPKVKVGRVVRFDPDELDDWIQENRPDGP